MTAKKTVIILREMLETVFEMFCKEGETYSLNAAEPSNKKSYLKSALLVPGYQRTLFVQLIYASYHVPTKSVDPFSA